MYDSLVTELLCIYSSVSTVTRLRAVRSGFDSRQGQRTDVFASAFIPALGPIQPPIQWVLDALSPEVKRPGREADHSPPSSAEVKNAWSYTSTPQYVFMASRLITLGLRHHVVFG
jgi:hypothetical protein